MRYSKLIWNHEFSDEPVEIYSQHDDDGLERRKVEIFRDESMGFASSTESSGGTELSLTLYPPDDEVNSEPEFRVVDISPEAFERIWAQARQPVNRA